MEFVPLKAARAGSDVRHVLGIDAGGTQTRALVADETGLALAGSRGGGANLRTHGEGGVEEVLRDVIGRALAEAQVRPEAAALGIAGADRPEDQTVLAAILRRLGFERHVVVTHDAHIALVAGSPARVGVALLCGTGSIAWGRNAKGATARSGGWGWQIGDEGSGFWIGERAIRRALHAADGRGPATKLERALSEHFGIERLEQILDVVYGAEFPRHDVARFAVRVAEAALSGDAVAGEVLSDAAGELRSAAESVVGRLRLEDGAYDVVLSGGTFRAIPSLAEAVGKSLASAKARVRFLEEEPVAGAVRLAIEELPPR